MGRRLYDGAWIESTLSRLAGEVEVRLAPGDELAVIGIRTRGAVVARRLAGRLRAKRPDLDYGELDITLYRDDIHEAAGRKAIGASDLSFDLEGKWVLLVDDVLSTGRTVRAALTELTDFGRPACVRLLVLVDRGGRELPIQPDFTGATVDADPARKLQVRLAEIDGTDAVEEI